ncbi:exonuclease domain-containing protein [Nocardiopsis halophila]|uniref:exonuclease domain-containing protein n=1 Tax=Nocardiopsis halophila TaxID=141692 RepID=UPI0003483E3C|nr:exonuclease domain-containing protein [Nocardiopsis halophila]
MVDGTGDPLPLEGLPFVENPAQDGRATAAGGSAGGTAAGPEAAEHDAWVALDFETANEDNGSVCRVGMVRVRGGRIVERHLEYVRPPAPADWFDPALAPYNGGVTAEDVRDAPEWPEALKRILAFTDGAPVVAHWARMEMDVIERACSYTSTEVPDLHFSCSYVLADAVWTDSRNHKLPTLCERIGFPLDHHNPLSDAEGSAEIVLALMRERGAPTLQALCEAENVSMGRVSPGRRALWCRRRDRGGRGDRFDRSGGRFARWNEHSKAEPPEPDLDADPDGPLYGAVVCLSDTRRDKIELWREVAAVGASISKNVTKKVTVLVVGDHAQATSKRRKAEEYRAKGQDIAIIDEAELEQILREGA